MLFRGREGGAFVVLCDRCLRRTLRTAATTREAARTAVVGAGWAERARLAKDSDRWEWWCPGCVTDAAGVAARAKKRGGPAL
jgi:hypothetical protein